MKKSLNERYAPSGRAASERSAPKPFAYALEHRHEEQARHRQLGEEAHRAAQHPPGHQPDEGEAHGVSGAPQRARRASHVS